MPSVDPRAAGIVKTIEEFEVSVAAADAALGVRDWARLDALLAQQHRLTHGLANALEETRDVRPAGFSAEVQRRIAGIKEQRADQLRRLIAFNHLVKERLSMIARSRDLHRNGAASALPPRILDLRQ